MSQKIRDSLLYVAIIYLVVLVSYVAFFRQPIYQVNYKPALQSKNNTPEGEFKVLYRFNDTSIPSTGKIEPYLVGNINGSGVIQSVAFHAGYYGIAVGYSVDNSAINWINNGECLKAWGADSVNAIGMPVILLSWNNNHDLDMAVNTPISFKKNFKLYFCNSDQKSSYPIRSLHVYGYFKDLRFANGNKLKI